MSWWFKQRYNSSPRNRGAKCRPLPPILRSTRLARLRRGSLYYALCSRRAYCNILDACSPVYNTHGWVLYLLLYYIFCSIWYMYLHIVYVEKKCSCVHAPYYILLYYYNYILYRRRKESAETRAGRRSGVWSRPRLEDTRTRTRTHPEAAWQTAYMPTFYPPRLKKHTHTHGNIIYVYINMPPILYDLYTWRMYDVTFIK